MSDFSVLQAKMRENARDACKDHPRLLLALDALDQAWRDSVDDGPVQLTWRQIDNLAMADLGELVPIQRPELPRDAA